MAGRFLSVLTFTWARPPPASGTPTIRPVISAAASSSSGLAGSVPWPVIIWWSQRDGESSGHRRGVQEGRGAELRGRVRVHAPAVFGPLDQVHDGGRQPLQGVPGRALPADEHHGDPVGGDPDDRFGHWAYALPVLDDVLDLDQLGLVVAGHRSC